MRPIVTDGVAWSVVQSVAIVSPAKTAEPIEMLFGTWPRVGPRKLKEPCKHGAAYLRNMANTIEPAICGGDAAYLSNLFDHLFCKSQIPLR